MRVCVGRIMRIADPAPRQSDKPRPSMRAYAPRNATQRAITQIKRQAGVILVGLFALTAALAPTVAPAQESAATSSSAVMIIGNDDGGLVSRRALEISRILSQGTHVEIRGQSCNSSCTMYLGMPDTCVLPQTSFGFHVPSHYGRQLSARDFEYGSQVIASHYPDPLRSWYLSEGRTRISDYFRISGSELIRLGVRQCSAQSGA